MKYFKYILITFSLLFIFSDTAFAVSASSVSSSAASSGFLDTVAGDFQDTIKGVSDGFVSGAKSLFTALAVISLTWTFGQLLLKGNSDVSALMFEVMRAILVLGFFWWLITGVPELLATLLNNFATWGSSLTDLNASSASAIIDEGMYISGRIFKQKVELDIFDLRLSVIALFFMGCILAIFILLTTVFIAINLVLYSIEFYFLCYIGIFVLGLSGASWTRDIAIQYLRKLVSVAISYFGVCIICGISIKIIQKYQDQLLANIHEGFGNSDLTGLYTDYCSMLIVFLILGKLVQMLPSSLSSLFGSGASAGYNPTLAAGAAAGAMGYGMMKGVGSVVKGGAQAIMNPAGTLKNIAQNYRRGLNLNSNAHGIGGAVGKTATNIQKAGAMVGKVSGKLSSYFGGK